MKHLNEYKVDDSSRYSREHTWARSEDNHIVIGITDYAQDQLGEIIYVDLPELDTTFEQNEVFGVVESVKTASDLYAPVGGKVIAVNHELVDEPERVNNDPFQEGWMIKMLPAKSNEMETLLAPAEYVDSLQPTE